jgi:flagellar assembly protein FliH
LSKVIKNFDDSVQAEACRAFDMAEVGGEALRIIRTAEQEAELILSDARTEAEAIKRRAHADGLKEALEAAKTRLEKQLAEEIKSRRAKEVDELVRVLGDAITEVNARRDGMERDARRDLVGLAIAVAAAVVKREVQCSDEVARLNLEEAIRLSARRSKILVRLSEQDVQIADAMLAEQQLLQTSPESAVEIIASSEIEPGGCVIESATGLIDARIETQLQEIETLLLGSEPND